MSNEQERDLTAIIILGMHRSGTSCLTGCLQQSGLHLGSVFEWNPHNLKGNRENPEVMKLNDEVLLQNGGSWDNPPQSVTWDAAQAAERNRIIATLSAHAGKYFGFKDPRTLFTLPFWEEALPRIKFIGTYRHPMSVAKSLHTRNPGEMPIEKGLELWKVYNARLISCVNAYNFPLVSFDVSSDDYLHSIERVFEHFGMGGKEVGCGFFDDELRHQQTPGQEDLPAEVAAMYQDLNAIFRQQAHL